MTHVFIALLLLISGVYYPVEVLPGVLCKLAVISPATYVLDGVRQALLNGTPLGALWPNIWPALLMGAVLIPMGLWVFRQAERYAKRKGNCRIFFDEVTFNASLSIKPIYPHKCSIVLHC